MAVVKGEEAIKHVLFSFALPSCYHCKVASNTWFSVTLNNLLYFDVSSSVAKNGTTHQDLINILISL